MSSIHHGGNLWTPYNTLIVSPSTRFHEGACLSTLTGLAGSAETCRCGDLPAPALRSQAAVLSFLELRVWCSAGCGASLHFPIRSADPLLGSKSATAFLSGGLFRRAGMLACRRKGSLTDNGSLLLARDLSLVSSGEGLLLSTSLPGGLQPINFISRSFYLSGRQFQSAVR